MAYNDYDPDHRPAPSERTYAIELPDTTVHALPTNMKAWLKQFHLTDDQIKDNFMATYSYSTPRLVSLIRNPKGDLIFWQARDVITNQTPKYINQKGLLKPAQSYTRKTTDSTHVIIVEDLISAIRLYSLGYDVHAVIGNRPSPEQTKYLQNLGVDYYILWLDPDIGGDQGAKFLKEKLKNYGMLLHISNELEPKYRTDAEIHEVLEDYDAPRHFNNDEDTPPWELS